MTLEEQIAALDKSAIEYAVMIANPRNTNADMAAYWVNIAQGWMMVIGLRKAQLRSLFRGMVLVA